MSGTITERSMANGAAIAGFLGIAGNVLAVCFLWPAPHSWKPGRLDLWYAEMAEKPVGAALSSWAFTLGLVALAAFFVLLGASSRARSPALVLLGALLAAGGALLDAAGTQAPYVAVALVGHEGETTRALLGTALALDASFNLLLGAGLMLINSGLGDCSGWPRWERGLGLVAALASLPVAGQLHSDAWANLLSIAGPLWLLWIGAASAQRLWIGVRVGVPAPAV
jgi:hypothetical protein